MRTALLAAAAVILQLGPSATSATADVAAFYKSTPITIIVGFGPGGGYEVYARALARHMPKHIPGFPTIVVQNMPGAGSMAAANYIYTTAPKDGSQIATFSRGIPTQPLFDQQGVRFDALKMNWIGSPASEVSMVFSAAERPFKTIDDVKEREMIVPASGTGADSAIYPSVMNKVLGTKFKIVNGYRGSGDFFLSVERGESDGTGGSSISTIRSTRPQWLKEKKINLIAQIALRKHPDFPDVPLAIDLAKSEDDKRVLQLVFSRQETAFPFAAPPGIPADRLAALRKGFNDTVRDPEFIAEAERQNIEVSLVTGEQVAKIIADAYASPPALIARARLAMSPPEEAGR